MATDNRYTPPTAKVADIHNDEVQPIRLFSPNGRIGRVRYLAYTTAATIIILVVAAVLSVVAGAIIGGILAVVLYIALMVYSIFMMIQRSHDMNWSGWTVFLAFVPLAGLIWLFKAGTDGPNDYGAPPPPNSKGVVIVACLLPVLIAVVGIVAAIAIPQFADYTDRAGQMELQQQLEQHGEPETESTPAQ